MAGIQYKVPRGTKARIETVKETLAGYTLVYSIDTHELGVKNIDGTITYFGEVETLDWSNILNKPNFAAVATSGNYTDLINRPDLSLKLDKDFSGLPNQASPLLTDVLVLNRGTTVQKVTLGSLLSQVDNEIFITVTTLPATGLPNKIYLVPSSNPQTQNSLDEYIWTNGAFERIGTVTVDLSDYYTKTAMDALLLNKVNANSAITGGTFTKITYDAKGLVISGTNLVAADIPNLDAAKITTGTLVDARIPNLNASKINAGVFNIARIPDISIAKVTGLQAILDMKVDMDGGDL